MSKVSVIIPIYNVEQYLEKCLDSVINQTYKNLEIICVNDCSPDNCAAILEKYAKQDKRIKIVTRKKNGGLSAARNSGLDCATGEYVYFIDSDDWIDLDYIEKMIDTINEANVDIVFNANILEEYENKTKCSEIPNYLYGSYLEGNNAIYKTRWSVWSHIYKRELLTTHKIKFPEDYIHEDVLFQNIAKYFAKKVFMFYGSSYHYAIRQNSIMTTKRNTIEAHIKIWKQVETFYKKFYSLENLQIKLFDSAIFLKIQNNDEFNLAKEYISHLDKYIKEKHYLFSDFEMFIINAIINSNFYSDYKNILGKIPYITYLTRFRIQRQKNIKVSVIIPVYNVEKYLARCLDSVVNQTLKDIEIICVNDGSLDNSLEILKEYAKIDNRIKIIDFKENKGVSAARNAGLEAAKGEYIGFVDPDDWIDLDFYEKLYTQAIKTHTDIVKGANLVSINGNEPSDFIYDLNTKIKENKFAFYIQFTTAIFKTDLINNNNVRFPEVMNNFEDPFFVTLLVYYAKEIVIEGTAQYYQRMRPDSASHTISDKSIEDVLYYYKYFFEFLENKISNADYCYFLDMSYKNLFVFRELHIKKNTKFYQQATQLFVNIIFKLKKLSKN